MASPVAAGEVCPPRTANTDASNPFQLREDVVPSDRAAVRSLVEGTGFFYPGEVDIAVELVDEYLARGAPSGYSFVFAESEAILAGYACFGPIPCTVASFDLYWIAVDPRFQRLGIGRKLMSAVESRIAAAGGRGIYIDTSGREQYASTRTFYEVCGFRPEAILKDFYAPGDDRVIYSKVMAGRSRSSE